jgi:LAS superfamily LD-carboxypeptidase LdcB
MARSAYKSAKRSKELLRQKKQEEKRLRRQGKVKPPEESQEHEAGEQNPEQGTSE